MRRFAIVGVGLLTISGFVGAASAADLPALPYAKARAPVMLYNWTGCYVGGHLGAVISQDKTTSASGESIAFSSTGFVGGGQIGCDYQFASNWVVGVEGQGAWTSLKNTHAAAVRNLGRGWSSRPNSP